MGSVERNRFKEKRRKAAVIGLVIVLLAAFCIYKTYLEKRPELIWYDRIEDEAFSILDFSEEDVTGLDLYSEVAERKSTADGRCISTLMESIGRAELMGKSRIVLDEDEGLGGGYTCFILFTLRSGDVYELRVSGMDENQENPEDSVFIFKMLKNGVLCGEYNSEYYGERFFFRGNVTASFREVYGEI